MQGNSCVEAMIFSDDNPRRDKISGNIFEALADGNDAAVLGKVRLLAEQGDATAQLLMGTFYQDGQRTTRYYDQAVEWYQRASDQGHPVGMLLLANRYERGEGISKDRDRARALYLD